MASVRLRCQICRERFSKPLGSRRVNCETCRPPRAKATALPPPEAPKVGPIEAQALADLEAAGRLDTVKGQTLLRLAREADSGRVTAAQLGSLASNLLKVEDAALAGARRPEPDRLDEVSERRRRKAAEAS